MINCYEFGPVVQEGIISIFNSGSCFLQRNNVICAILVEGFMGNNKVKLV